MSKNRVKLGVIIMSLLVGSYYCISPVISKIAEAFPEIGVSNIQMLITIPNFMSMVVGVLAGWLVVKFSKKQIMIGGLLIIAVLGILPMFLNNFAAILATRVLLGIGVGLIIPTNTAIISEQFEGPEKSAMMGIQSACVGLGMIGMNMLAGFLGASNYKYAFLIYLLSFAGALGTWLTIPETGKAVPTKTEKISLNKKAVLFSTYGFLHSVLIITFTTNIAFHISGVYAGNTGVSGTVTSLYSVGQLLIGLTFGLIAGLTKKFTLPASTLCGGAGFLLLLLFPDSLPMLFVGALLCGASQGMFMPQAFVEVTSCVPEVAATLASGCLNIFNSLGQLTSPYIINAMATGLLGDASTNHVFLISTVGMLVFGVLVMVGFALWRKDAA